MPCPFGLVEKNGVNSLVSTSLLMPAPVSPISSINGEAEVRMLMCPFASMLSAEFLMILISTCSNREMSSSTVGFSSHKSMVSSMSLLWQMFSMNVLHATTRSFSFASSS